MHLSLDDLRRTFPSHTVVATLQCAGNRRRDFDALHPTPGEISWGPEAVGTAAWRGVLLRDICNLVGCDPSTQHIAFEGFDRVNPVGGAQYRVSVPFDKAMASETILAYEMNRVPLPVLHGGPLRVVVPGFIGARSVKWLSRITAQHAPASDQHQQRAYKLLPMDAGETAEDWEQYPPIDPVCVTSAICLPSDDAVCHGGHVRVCGYAIASAGASVERVELTTTGGSEWIPARLRGRPAPWTWRPWDTVLDLTCGQHTIAVCATDSSGATQPADLRRLCNVKGYMNNAWHRVRVCVSPEACSERARSRAASSANARAT